MVRLLFPRGVGSFCRKGSLDQPLSIQCSSIRLRVFKDVCIHVPFSRVIIKAIIALISNVDKGVELKVFLSAVFAD